MTIYIHFLHGFLGLPADWNKITPHLPFQSIVHSLDNLTSFAASANAFNEAAERLNGSLLSPPAKHIFVGYSLGGRLGLHSLCLGHPWHAAVFISANPGLTTESEKEARIAHDAAWAMRFQIEPWNKVTESWDAQSVFAGQKNRLARQEENFDRQKLAHLLTEFSLSKQQNLRPQIKNIQTPILWVSGAQDTKFTALATEMAQLNSNIQAWVCPDAGHRVPWESTENFVGKLQEFIGSNLKK